jgi:hypothetical protein
MTLTSRIKGIILTPQTEWETIENENAGIRDLYVGYIAILAAIPPFASFFSAWLFGFSRGHLGYVHATFGAGIFRAVVQYLLSLPLLFMVAFIISMAAPYFEGKSDDRRALALAAYSFTPAWLAAFFGLIPGLRWLDVLGFYGVYVFSRGAPRMMRIPQENLDVFTLVALFAAIAAGALHAWIVHAIAPAQMV